MILLSFDIEEFDMPLEYGGEISFEEQIEVSRKGLENVLSILKKHRIKATFFSTVVFAEKNKDLVEKLLLEGHELASHTWFHSKFSVEDLKNSKDKLEKMFNTKILGLRMPRMSKVDVVDVESAGYLYNSSINPTFLIGRYNNLNISREFFFQKSVLQIPASVSPMRIPLFWLSFHNFPIKIYRYLVRKALRKDKYLNLYFHPWEFSHIIDKKYKLPLYTTKNTGEKMQKRFDEFIYWLKENNANFMTFNDFYQRISKKIT